MNNPFRSQINSVYENNLITQYRWERTLQFLEPLTGIEKGLDIGDRTQMTDKLEQIFQIPFDTTNIDLDEEELFGTYDIVTSFEVIEHLFNPLFHLTQVCKVLKPKGRLFLSTPLSKPQFLWSPEHFHEMSEHSLYALIEQAKFRILRRDTFRIRPVYQYFLGIRPLLRGIFERVLICEMIPTENTSE